MSSTNLDAPSTKLTLAAIAIVVGLHVLTAVALASVKTPEMKVEPEKVIPPIEIELITPPPPPPVEIEEVNLKEDPEPVREVKPKPKAKPVAAPKPKVVQKKQPIEKPKPPKLTPPPVKKIQETVTTPANNEANILAVRQREQAEREQAEREQAQREQAQREQAEREQAEREQAEREQAQKEQAQREQAQREQAQREQAAAAASNTPQRFSGSDASWIVAPNFEGVSDKAGTFTVRFTVTKQGVIQNIKVSGADRDVITKVKQKMRRSKIKPFIRGGVAVVGNVTMPVVVQ